MTSPRVLLNAHALRPRRQLGQNFLVDPSTAQMIVSRARLRPEEVVVEIGAGLGALTVPLGQSARRVYAVEKDHHLCEILRGQLEAAHISNVELVEADILDLDWSGIARQACQPLAVFGNLPYNISSQVVIRLIESRRWVSRAVLMFQRELATRLTAAPGGKDYGRITAMLSYCAAVTRLAVVKAKGFYPSPKVDSEVLEITFTPEKSYPAHDETRLFQLIAAAFGQRRKTLKNALSAPGSPIPAEAVAGALARAGIDPARRAETLSAQEFVALEISVESALFAGAHPNRFTP